MHIVYVSREYPPSQRGGGIASYLKIMAEGFAALGQKVTVIAASDDTRKSSDEMVNGVRVIRLSGGDFCLREAEPNAPFVARLRLLYRFNSYRKRIRKAVESLENVDIIEVAEFGAEGLYLKNIETPVVYRLHTPALLDHKLFSVQRLNRSNFMYYLNGRIELSLLKDARHITSCSSSLKRWTERFVGVDDSRIKVIFNPLQRDFLTSRAQATPSDSQMVFFAGTICDWKGAGDLAEACRLINAQGQNVTLKMAGKTGSFAQELRHEYADARWLEILGKLPQRELKELYTAAGAVCFPSWWENMPMVCIEAMGQGAIVIGSNSGGMAEIIEDGVSGFLLPPNDPGLWADKIREVLALDPEVRRAISVNAIMRIKNLFSLEKILDETRRYYESCINDQRALNDKWALSL